MIVWSGRGALSAIVLIVVFVLFAQILPSAYSDYAFVVALFSTAGFSWFMGKKWHGEPGRMVIDKATGQEIEIKPHHSLFWIKMEYWGVIFGVLGLVILIQQFL
jgi:hypothetical protein